MAASPELEGHTNILCHLTEGQPQSWRSPHRSQHLASNHLTHQMQGIKVIFWKLIMNWQAITRSRAANSNGEEYNMNLPLWGLSELAIRWHDWQKCTIPLLKAVFTVFICFLSPCFVSLALPSFSQIFVETFKKERFFNQGVFSAKRQQLWSL